MAVTLNASTSSGFIQTADTSGELNLQSNGTTKLSVLSTGVSGTLVQGTAVASTSGTSIDFTGIPSWVKRITVMFSGVSTSGTSAPIVQLGDSGGVETSGYVGSAGYVGAFVNLTSGFFITNTTGAANTFQGIMTISLLNSITNNYSCSSTIGITGNQIVYTCGGAKTTSDTLTQVRITTVGGTDTFDAGTINIQYEG